MQPINWHLQTSSGIKLVSSSVETLSLLARAEPAIGPRCSGLRLSADEPEIDAVYGPGLTETVGGNWPTIAENEPALRETERRSLGQGRTR